VAQTDPSADLGPYADLKPGSPSAPAHADLGPYADLSPASPHIRASAGQHGPLAPLVPIATGAARAAGTGVGRIFDLLNRPHEAVTAAVTGGAGKLLPTLAHGQSEKSADETRAELRHKMGLDDPNSPMGSTGTYQDAPHWAQGVVDTAIDTATDPLTYAGGFGLLERAVKAGGKALPLFARAVTALEQRGGAAAPAARLARSSFDFANYKGGTLRQLAARSGMKGVEQFHGLKAINNARSSRAQDLGNTLVGEFRDVTKGLSDDEKTTLYDAVHRGAIDALPPNLKARAQRFSNVTDALAHLSGTRALRSQLSEHGFTLPDYAKRFDTQVRSLQRPSQYRKDYVPTAHELDTNLGVGSRPGSMAELDARIAGEAKRTANEARGSGMIRTMLDATMPENTLGKRTTVGLDTRDANLLERGDGAQLLEPEMQAKVIEARLRSGAKAISARDAEREAARLFGVGGFSKVPAPAKAFFQETYTQPEDKQFWNHLGDALKGAIDIPKHGLFALPFRHMANIATLSIFADPSIENITGTAGRFARLLLSRSDEARANVLGKALKYGVTGVPSGDRDAGWTGKIPLIGELYKASNHVLWSFDDAAKATRFQRLLDRYKGQGIAEPRAAYRAANEVGAELIDYSNRSPLTQFFSYVAPFATYRTKVPGAIARLVAKHPERVLVAGRASPELVGDVQQGPAGSGKVGKAYLPTADVLRAGDSPEEYARATMGYPLQMALSKISGAFGTGDHPWTYGKNPDWKYALNATAGSFPGVDAALNKTGLGEFPKQGGGVLSDLVRSQTGFSLTGGATPRQQRAAFHVAVERAAIAAARSAGNDAVADERERKLESYVHFNHLYEK